MVSAGRHIARLRAFTASRRARATAPDGLGCELCVVPLQEQEHEHLWSPSALDLTCVCGACAALFPDIASPEAPRLRVRKKRVALQKTFSAACWEALGVPVRLAFFRRVLGGSVIATLPSAAGAVEMPVSSEAWHFVTGSCGAGSGLAVETEVLLASDLDAPRLWLASIDFGFQVLGALRRSRMAGSLLLRPSDADAGLCDSLSSGGPPCKL